uniref:Uncharacterized protein n=1 Tax=Nitrosopumivirus cobalaminus TaxID=3158414 RepID=A0AAU7N471_9VIRU
MGVGFYSKIRSGVSSDSASINDIYQKLKEGIVGFSVADVLEDRISNLIEPINVTEFFRLHGANRQTEPVTIVESIFINILRRVSVRLLPDGAVGLAGQNIPQGLPATYTGQTILLPDYGNTATTTTDEKYPQNVWLIVRGFFEIISDGISLIDDDYIDGADYDPLSTDFSVIQISFDGNPSNQIMYSVNGDAFKPLDNGRNANVTIRRNTQITGEFNAIWCSVLASGGDTNTFTRISNGTYDLTNIEFGLFGTGRILCSSRLPMYLN